MVAAARTALDRIVTTNEVIVSPQITGQISKLMVTEGDEVSGITHRVHHPDELRTEIDYLAAHG